MSIIGLGGIGAVKKTDVIKYKKGSDYQTGKYWTVYANDTSSGISIEVDGSSGWSLDPHDTRGEIFRLMSSGKKIATMRFKNVNIDNFAKQMHSISKSEIGSIYDFSPKKYAQVIRLWMDMKIYKNK